MRGAELRTVVPVVVLLLASACSAGGEVMSTTAVPDPPTTLAPTTSTTVAQTTTTVLQTTTSTEPGRDEVGSRETLLAAIEHAIRETEDFYDYDPSEVPIPDLTNPDPEVALREMLLFEAWILANAPDSNWAAIYSIPGSPAETTLLSALDATFMVVWRFDDAPGIEIHQVSALGNEEESGIPQRVLAAIPTESRFFKYEFTVSPYEQYDLELRQSVRVFRGTTASSVVVISPGPHGWARYYSETQ